MKGALRTGRNGPHPDAPKPRTGKSGMTFKPELARKVKAGEKTETRRLRMPRQAYRLQPGDDVAAQPGRGKRAVCRITILEVRAELLGDLDHAAARAEGFRTTCEFYAYWRALHHVGLAARHRDLLERLADAPGPLAAEHLHPGLSQRAVTTRLRALERQALVYREHDGRWELSDAGADRLIDELDGIDLETPVWAITFSVCREGTDRRKLLVPAGVAGRDFDGEPLGYTDTPGEALWGERGGEPEVIESRELAAHWQERAERDHTEANLHTLEHRLARARERAARERIDIANHERAIADRVARLERALERHPGEAA